MGIEAREEDVLLSTHDLLSWLEKMDARDTYLVGTEGMRDMMESAGFNTRSESPEYVVLGMTRR